MRWNYYVTKDGSRGYWSPMAPFQVEDRYLASIEADEMPTKTPFDMQIEGIHRQAKATGTEA